MRVFPLYTTLSFTSYPSEAEKQRILALYLDRYGVDDELTRRRLQQTLTRDLGRLHLVPAHIEEFVKAGIKRALGPPRAGISRFRAGDRSDQIDRGLQAGGVAERPVMASEATQTIRSALPAMTIKQWRPVSFRVAYGSPVTASAAIHS